MMRNRRPHKDDPVNGCTIEDLEVSGSENGGNNQNVPKSEPANLFSRSNVTAVLVVAIGAMAFVIIATFGVVRLRDNEQDHFMKIASNIAEQVESTWRMLLLSSLWLYRSGKFIDSLNYTEIIEACSYTEATGIQAIGFAYNVSNGARYSRENKTREYLEANYNDVDYEGFSGYERKGTSQNFELRHRTERPYYFPVQYVSPVICNEDAIDFDLLSMNATRKALDAALTLKSVVATQRIGPQEDPKSIFSSGENSILILNPGISGSIDPFVSVVVVRIPLFLLACNGFHKPAYTYLYDFTDGGDSPVFLGGALHDSSTKSGEPLQPTIKTGCRSKRKKNITYSNNSVEDDNLAGSLSDVHDEHVSHLSPEISYNALMSRSIFKYEQDMNFAKRQWKLVIVAPQEATEPNLAFVFLGGATVFVAAVCIALWIYSDHRKDIKISSIKAAGEAERSALLVDSARKSAVKERELNDFIAHEVRNPLSAALSACSFVSSAVEENNPLATEEARKQVREDIYVIDLSLHFIDDLLRNMLDVHRAAGEQLSLDLVATDLLVDVLEPTASMMFQRGGNFETYVECPKDLIIMTDRLRLRQIMLNLGLNAAKFVQRGFIRFRASITNGNKVIIYVEDSGCGIPEEKRKNLFCKFQVSLDSLNHGSGVGLCVCRSIIDLMGGSLQLDNNYHSGVHDCPGSRFIIDPNAPIVRRSPINMNSMEQEPETSWGLPERLSILFVDDDMMLRKLFCRSVKRLAPQWRVEEASSGETALKMVESDAYDLIFLDHYMASIDKQLLGTDTARALREKGVSCVICGLSANDMEQAFLEAGANSFIMKPFPCATALLKQELMRVLENGGRMSNNGAIKSQG